MSVEQLSDKRWICRYPKGKDVSRPTTNKKYFGRGPGAEQRANAFNEFLGLGAHAPESSPLFAELAAAYLSSKKSSLAPSSLVNIVGKLEKTILPLMGSEQAHNLTPSRLDEYVRVRSRVVKNTSVHRELSDIRAIILWSVKRNLIASNPMSGFDMPKRDDTEIQPPSVAEFDAILACASPHVKRAMLITRHVGLRPGKEELFCLTWDSFDVINRTLTVVSARKGGIPLRIVPLNNVIFDYLNKWYEEDSGDGYIVHYHGASVLKINKAWAAAKRRAKVRRKLPVYSLRHMFVTQLLERGADIKSVSELAGSSPEIIMRWYQYVSTDLKRKTIDLLN